jgi:hypothetical protein
VPGVIYFLPWWQNFGIGGNLYSKHIYNARKDTVIPKNKCATKYATNKRRRISMPDFINAQILKDNSVDAGKKFKGTMYVKKTCYLKIDSLMSLTESSSRKDVIEKAIDFYFGFVTSQLSQDFLCGAFGSKMEGLVSSLATRISKGNFRTAVEMDLLTRMLATVVQLNKNDYEKLRVKSIRDVKSTNGSIDILEAVNESEVDIIVEPPNY